MRSRMKFLVLITALLTFISISAYSESTSSAMRSFGLIGTWSRDCARDASQKCQSLGKGEAICGIRITFDVPLLFGTPMMITVADGKTRREEIVSAGQITKAKLKFSYVISERLSLAPKYFPVTGEIWTLVFEKSDDNVKVIESQRQDGNKVLVKDGFLYRSAGENAWESTGKSADTLEQCRD